MRRFFLLSLFLPLGGLVYACSSKDETPPPQAEPDGSAPPNPTTTGTTPPPPPPDDGGFNFDATTDAGGYVDPIKGAPAPTKATEVVGVTFIDGIQWRATESALYFTVPYDPGDFYKWKPGDLTPTLVRTGGYSIGNGLNKANEIVTAEAVPPRVTRTRADGGVEEIASSADGGAAAIPFLAPNDIAVSKAGVLYVTDPAYQNPGTNSIFWISGQGGANLIEAFPQQDGPNGVSISPDDKTLYVSFTNPPPPALPFIAKYPLNAQGVPGVRAKFADVGANSDPDGLAVNDQGDVFVARKRVTDAGATLGAVDVFKDDGSKIGSINVPEPATSIGFGGADRKTLFIGTQGPTIYQVKLNVAGLPH
jgi:gluconolactonase